MFFFLKKIHTFHMVVFCLKNWQHWKSCICFRSSSFELFFQLLIEIVKGFSFWESQNKIKSVIFAFKYNFKLYSCISLYKWSIKIIPHEMLFFLKTHFKFQVDVGLRTSMKGLNWLDQMLFFSKKYILFTMLSFSKNWQHFHSISNYNHPCL